MSWGDHEHEEINRKFGINERLEKAKEAKKHSDKAENLPISGVVDFQPTAWKGDEFKHGDTALIDWGNGRQTPCRVLGWTTPYGGWWYVQIENGGMHYTQRLVPQKTIANNKS